MSSCKALYAGQDNIFSASTLLSSVVGRVGTLQMVYTFVWLLQANSLICTTTQLHNNVYQTVSLQTGNSMYTCSLHKDCIATD